MSPYMRKLVYIVAAVFFIVITRGLLADKEDVTAEERAATTRGGRRRDDALCARVFSAADARLFWETTSEFADGCRPTTLDPVGSRHCLERRLATRGRRTVIAFVGDSRARILFEMLIKQLNLPWEGRAISDVFAPLLPSPNVTLKVLGSPKLCTSGFLLRFIPEKNTQLAACDASAGDDALRAQFFWRRYVDADYLDSLSALISACRRGVDCPDVVVITAGMWYAKTFRNYVAPLHERVLKFRRDTLALVESLRALARYSKVVYKLDGPELTESKRTKSRIGGTIAAINAAAFGVMAQVQGAQMWTSSLIDSLRFYHSVCMPLGRDDAMHTQIVRSHCLDENHVGDTLRRNAVRTLLGYVCRDTLVRLPGQCCGRAAE